MDQGRERKSHDNHNPKAIAKESIASVLLFFSVVHHVCLVVLIELPSFVLLVEEEWLRVNLWKDVICNAQLRRRGTKKRRASAAEELLQEFIAMGLNVCRACSPVTFSLSVVVVDQPAKGNNPNTTRANG